MEKIPCSVIQDLLPLYLEEAVSRETKDAVQAHLKRLKYVKSFHLGEFGEGDAGVTIAEFKD